MKIYYSFFLILILTSCGSNNIEDQIDEIIRTSEKEEINEIAYSLADSLDVKASKLLIDLHPKQTIKPDGTTDFIAIATERRVRWALQGIISRYSGIKDSKREICLSYITDPNFDGLGTIPYSINYNSSETGEEVFALGYPKPTDLGLEIKGNKRNFNQGLAKANDQFALFDPGASVVDFMHHAPPLTTPFGEYVTPPTTNVLAFQKIGSVETQMPLWSFNNQNDYRIGICAGEGLWRWKFYDYETNESFNNIDVLLRKTIQYLALKDDKRKFKVYTSSKSFFENDRITFIGEVYNDSYEFTPEANVQVTLNHSDGTQYTYALVPQNGAYRYAIGALPVGNYTFSASAQYNGKKYKESGRFDHHYIHKLRLFIECEH